MNLREYFTSLSIRVLSASIITNAIIVLKSFRLMKDGVLNMLWPVIVHLHRDKTVKLHDLTTFPSYELWYEPSTASFFKIYKNTANIQLKI